jgi:hypothetical protein
MGYQGVFLLNCFESSSGSIGLETGSVLPRNTVQVAHVLHCNHHQMSSRATTAFTPRGR